MARSMLLLQGMNTLRPILLTLTAVAALSFAYPASANLITNPGFETGDFTGWTGSLIGGVVGTAFGVSPHSGSFQAEVFLGSSVSPLRRQLARPTQLTSFWPTPGP
jgi:hypothetical protein